VLFEYEEDKSDRDLIALALQVLGMKMNGRVEPPHQIAMRIMGTAAAQQQQLQQQQQQQLQQQQRHQQQLQQPLQIQHHYQQQQIPLHQPQQQRQQQLQLQQPQLQRPQDNQWVKKKQSSPAPRPPSRPATPRALSAPIVVAHPIARATKMTPTAATPGALTPIQLQSPHSQMFQSSSR